MEIALRMIFKIKEELFSDGTKRYVALGCIDEDKGFCYGLCCETIKEAEDWIKWQKKLMGPTMVKERIIMEEKYERP